MGGVVVKGEQREEDAAKERDSAYTTNVLKRCIGEMDTLLGWSQDPALGYAYDGQLALYSTKKLVFPRHTEDEIEAVAASNVNKADEMRKENDAADECRKDVILLGARAPCARVTLKLVREVQLPLSDTADRCWQPGGGGVEPPQWRKDAAQTAVQALDVSLLGFARWQSNEAHPKWILNGSKIFQARGGQEYDLGPKFTGLLGYYASLKETRSGLALVKDISVTCFLRSGPLVPFMCKLLGCRDAQDLVRQFGQGQGRMEHGMREALQLLKNCKIYTTHLKQTKQLRAFGPPADSPDSAFEDDQGNQITVAQYFAAKHTALPNKYPRLLYPGLPTVEWGSKNRPIRCPMELVEVIAGQTRQRSVDGTVSGKIIQHAAMLPNDRFRSISSDSELFRAIGEDADAKCFGLDSVGIGGDGGVRPQRVVGTILPPAKLQYANKVVEPGLKGTWNLMQLKFSHPATSRDGSGTIKFACVFLHDGRNSNPQAAERLTSALEEKSARLNFPLASVTGRGAVVSVAFGGRNLRERLKSEFARFKASGAGIVVVVLGERDFYGEVKVCGDAHCLPTQCCMLEKVSKHQDQYEMNVLMKMNPKLGGTNCTLTQRGTPRGPSFQQPPESISWMFDAKAMVVGVDVNHPNPGQAEGSPSVVAVVASTDGMLGQYAAYVTSVEGNNEPVETAVLQPIFSELLRVFCQRNEGSMPQHIILYRDGVADNQIDGLKSEIKALEGAISDLGLPIDSVGIVVLVCQKRHHTRLAYQANPQAPYVNPCVGLVVDSRGEDALSSVPDPVGCILGPSLNEFYLNSHAAVLGTSKPTKYILVHDSIGVKICELELLTHWICHTYARCCRSVSLATPAYYAHWAARRGKVLLSSGLSREDLESTSRAWLAPNVPPSLYFI
mmetsp:Transcript_13919/g.30553  ORF Transcript_13919/g.30553 Transcript_13919/m.30553 type:complete len:898 (+) Transcript_13919:485-3178(+)